MPEIEAVIWDMDGVLADTAPYHFSAWQEIFQKKGVKFTEEDFCYSFGLRNDSIIRHVLGQQTTQDEIEAIAREKEATFRKMIGQNIKPLPGAVELLQSLRKHGVKMAIASSTPIENIRLITSSLGIANCFQTIVTGHDVTEGKPSPQVFLLAAQRLGVKPGNCVVIEDAVAGVTAARKAGMHCVAITTTHPKESLKQADLIVDTLETITVKDLVGLLHPP
jgi:beta-phosphoglucomutase family hydrolase